MTKRMETAMPWTARRPKTLTAKLERSVSSARESLRRILSDLFAPASDLERRADAISEPPGASAVEKS
jgi:hypothetical protein